MIKAIIIGAASGMGKHAAKLLAGKGYNLALVDNQFDLLKEFASSLDDLTIIKKIDVAQHMEARGQVLQMIRELGGLDLFVYCAGIKNKSGVWENEYNLHQVNAIGFAALAHVVFNYF